MQLDVEKKLIYFDLKYRLIELANTAMTVDDVVKFSKGDILVEEISKTIIVTGKKSGKSFGILLRGNDKLNFGALKRFFGEEMKVATPETVKEVSGVEPGAVCPFLLSVELFVDQNITELPKINCGSGHHLYGLEFSFTDLSKVVKYQVANFAK